LKNTPSHCLGVLYEERFIAESGERYHKAKIIISCLVAKREIRYRKRSIVNFVSSSHQIEIYTALQRVGYFKRKSAIVSTTKSVSIISRRFTPVSAIFEPE